MATKITLAGPTAASEQGYPGFRWLVLILASLRCISMQMVNLSVAPLVPVIAASLNTDPGTATNVLMTSFLFSGSVMWVAVGGYICDRFGVFVSLILGFLCLAVPAALMPWIGISTTGILLARMIEGLSTGCMYPAVQAVVNTLFPPSQKGIANGLMNSSVAVGSSAGVLLGPLVLKAVGEWKIMSASLSIFVWACLVMGIILFVAYECQAAQRRGYGCRRREGIGL